MKKDLLKNDGDRLSRRRHKNRIKAVLATVAAATFHRPGAKHMSETTFIRTTFDGHVATVVFNRPPHNFANPPLIRELLQTLQALDADDNCRCVVLTSEGKNFCAGVDFSGAVGEDSGGGDTADRDTGDVAAGLYATALKLFTTRKPIVAAVQGAAVGAGAGLALVADFRIVTADTRFAFNFNRLGFHPGFGISHTLPRLVGVQKAAALMYTGRRFGGEEAVAMGLADELAPADALLATAQAFAKNIAESAPVAVQSTRQTLRAGLAEAVQAINQHELAEQRLHFATADFQEGVKAMAERRTPAFTGR